MMGLPFISSKVESVRLKYGGPLEWDVSRPNMGTDFSCHLAEIWGKNGTYNYNGSRSSQNTPIHTKINTSRMNQRFQDIFLVKSYVEFDFNTQSDCDCT